MKRSRYAMLVAGALLAASVSQASILAHWDFNDPLLGAADGVALPDSTAYTVWNEAATDKSGNGNHLTVWDSSNGGYTWTNNSYAGDFAITPSGTTPSAFTWSTQSGPSGVDVETATPTNLTVEALFTVDGGDGSFRTLVGRDGQNLSGAAANAALYFGLDNANHVIFEFTDVSGNRVRLISSVTVLADPEKWHHLAGTSDGSTVSLYLDGAVVASSATAMGGLAIGTTSGSEWHAGGWSVGRGLYGGNRGDWFNGKIDAVAISDTALDLSTFVLSKNELVLNSVSPEGPTVNPVVLAAEISDWGTATLSSAGLYLDGVLVKDSFSTSGSSHTISYSAGNLAEGSYTGRVVYVDNASNAATNDWFFTIAKTIPSGSILYNINIAGRANANVEVPNGTIIPAVGDSTGANYWNNYVEDSTSATTTNEPATLVATNATDGSSSINFTWSGSNRDWSSANAGSPVTALNQGYWGVANFDGSVLLSGLNTNSTYDVYVYFTWTWNTSAAVTYTLTNGTSSAANSLELVRQPSTASAYEDFVQATPTNTSGNYVVFSNVTASAAGVIAIRAQSGDGGFNAIQLVETPGGPAFAPTINSISIAGGSVTINWNSDVIGTYRIERKTSLTSPTWNPVAGATGLSGGAGNNTSFSVSGDPAEFFRVYGE